MLFPISPHITDSYAFLKYLAQNLKKFMITCRFETGAKKCLRLEPGRYLLNSTPIIRQSGLFGPMEQFLVGNDDPDFTMVFNPLYNVNNMLLGQIFGDGLALLRLSMLSVPQGAETEKWIRNKQMQEEYTEREMRRLVPLSKYRKSTPWTEYISIIGDDAMLAEKDLDAVIGINRRGKTEGNPFCLFTYPIIVRHLKRREDENSVEVDRELCDKIAGSRKDDPKGQNQKYLKLELNIKGPLNAEELEKALVLYTNQSLAEFMVEKSYEIFELGIRATLLSVRTKAAKEKNQAMLDRVHDFERWMRRVYDFARDVRSPLFFSTELPVLTDYRYHISLISKMIGEISRKILLPNISSMQLEGLCLYLVVYVVNNSDGALQKMYFIKNVQNHAQLYTFLRRTLTFQNIEMRNRTVRYELILLSRSIPELRTLFTPSKELPGCSEGVVDEDTIAFVDCYQAESLTQTRRVRSFNVNSAASELPNAFSSDENEETMGNIKAQHVIQVSSASVCHEVPRTVFLRMTLRRAGITLHAYNFARKSVEILERTLSLAVLWYNKKSTALTDLLMRKLGIAVSKSPASENILGGRQPAGMRPERTFAMSATTEFVERTLQNKHLSELNMYIPQERAAVMRCTILGDPQVFESEFKPKVAAAQDYVLRAKLSELANDRIADEKEIAQQGAVARVELNDFEPETGNYMSDAVRMLWMGTEFYRTVVRRQRALKYMYVNPLQYHVARPQLSCEVFRREHQGLVDRLQFYAKYTRTNMADMSPEKREREEKLFKYMNMANVGKKDTAELISAVLGMSTLCYSCTAPFMFNYSYGCRGNGETGEVTEDPAKAKAKKSYVKILNDYFSGLCQLIKTQCGFTETFVTNVNPNFMDLEYNNTDMSERTYIGKSATQFFPQRPIDEPPPFKFRKATSSSSLSSKKDSLLEKDERYFLVSNAAACKGAGHKLPPVRCLKLKECKAYFLHVAYNAAYIIELECMYNVSEVRVWTLRELVGTEHLPSFDKVFLDQADRLPEYQTAGLQVDHQLSTIAETVRLDAFNYDVHVQSLILVLNGCREQRGFLDVVTSFLRYYPDPPKRAKNSVRACLLSIYMGDIDSDPEAFWKYFVGHAQMYGYKAQAYNQLTFCGVLESETFVDSTGSLKYNRDMEDKKESYAQGGDSSLGLGRSSDYAHCDMEVVQESLNKQSSAKSIANHRKSHTSTTLPQFTAVVTGSPSPQLVREDSAVIMEKGISSVPLNSPRR